MYRPVQTDLTNYSALYNSTTSKEGPPTCHRSSKHRVRDETATDLNEGIVRGERKVKDKRYGIISLLK